MLTISSVLIGVKSLEKAKPFYENVLGFVFDEFRPPFASAHLGEIEFNIEENADYRSADWAEKHIGRRNSVSFQTDDLEEFIEKARGLGATIVQESTDTAWGWREAIIADPDGNEFLVEQEVE